MTDALINLGVELAWIVEQYIEKEANLIVGVEKEIKKLEDTVKVIEAVLSDAEKRQFKDEGVKMWLKELKDTSYDAEDLLAKWITPILKQQNEGVESNVPNPKHKVFSYITFPCCRFNSVLHRRDTTLKIKGIHERLNRINREKETYKFEVEAMEKPERSKTDSFVDVSDVHGRVLERNTLVNNLLCENEDSDSHPHIISVVGMGGIGKTTLAQQVYHCAEVQAHFQRKMWVCVSEPFDVVRVAKAIVEDAEGNAPNFVELETVLSKVRNSILGNKFLLVLDDVWTEDDTKWDQLKRSLKIGARGSTVLVTTRSVRVAKMMGTKATHMIRLEQLSNQDCWSLFSHIAFFERSKEDTEKLQDIGRKISDKCKGLPLFAKAIGSLMRFKNTEDWQGVLDSEIWELEVAETRLLPPLLLSYYDLPPAIKRCFSYCAVFPEDYKIETDNLIKLWMAQGYLSSGGRKKEASTEMETKGREYVENLVMRSFFQDIEKDKEGGNIVRFKMHDMVRGFAQFLSKNECFTMNAGSGTETRMGLSPESIPRHLTILRTEEAPFPDPIDNTDKLHTFWIQSFYDCPPIVSLKDKVPSDWFHRLTCLRALDLSRNGLNELPREVGRLMILKYLNLSHNPLQELPETLCDLFNLQTLKLVACDHLNKLPKGMGKLKNLRHLEIDRTDCLTVLPEGIGKLSSLRTLSKFVVGSCESEAAGCKLGDLQNLNHLRGKLKIEGLGYVADTVEAEKAELNNKRHLLDLYLDFSPFMQTEGITDVVEALQLPQNLNYLQLKFYGGTQFPNWMLSLINLRKLQLQECQNCLCLPPLGRLPYLESLYIDAMHSLKSVSVEFLGIGNDNDGDDDNIMASDGTRASSFVVTAFPKLKKLKIGNMRSWEEWNVISTRGKNIKIMPCLRCLKLSRCQKLEALPHHLLEMAPIKKLRINSCPILQKRYKKVIGEDWSKISHIPKVRIS